MSIEPVVCAALAVAAAASGSAPTRAELALRDAWVRQHFARPKRPPQPRVQAPAPAAGLLVIHNHGPVLRNGRPDGRRLKLADREFAHGLICHSPSKVIVCLPSPAARFEAWVGVDAHAGGGSVVFTVRSDRRELFRSPTMHGGEPGVRVSVNLAGARQFTIESSDAGDGISSDHADWADASVTLQDGTTVKVADLADVGPVTPPRGTASPPFAFHYGGISSDALLPAWERRRQTARLSGRRTRTTDTYTDPRTRLEVRCVRVTYADFPTVEWTVHLRNGGTSDTPIIEGLQALDLPFEPGPSGRFTLHRFVGSPCREDDYRPIEEPMGPGATCRVTAAGGRPTNTDLCYFNLSAGDSGVLLALGWPGQWSAAFEPASDTTVRIVAGQETTRFVLRPGEEARTPLVALQFYRGRDWLSAQNVWRRWMLAHNLPRPGGKPIPTHYAGCFGNPLPRAEEEIAQIRGVANDGVKLDYWFVDAGWYPCGDSWVYTGTWEPDPQRFPRGLTEVGDVLGELGVGFIVWFEPERVTGGSWLAGKPEWLLGGTLLDMGNTEARRWVTERVDSLMKAGHVEVYRTDFNMDPLPYWQMADADDRIGITENHCVTGLLAFWDELLARDPRRWIDTCASGGRRNDLETLRRAVPLLRSDWAVIQFGPDGAIGQQAQTWGISLWMPYHGTGAPCGDPYVMRSSYTPAFRMGWDATDPKRDPAILRRSVAEFRRVAPYMLGDFHPLTPYSLSPADWMAWQYNVQEGQDVIQGGRGSNPGGRGSNPGGRGSFRAGGVVQAFRRQDSAEAEVRLRLRGLTASASYIVEDLDTGTVTRASGRELMGNGLKVRIETRPGAAMFMYHQASTSEDGS